MGLLRVLLAFFVVISHTENFFGFSFMGGQVAVEIFFIISGFYMTMILSEKYNYRGGYLTFIKNRFLKIYPIYWFVLFLTFIVSICTLIIFNKGFSFYLDYYSLLDIHTLLFLMFTNVFIFGQDIIMFLCLDNKGSLEFTNNFVETYPLLWKGLLIQQAWTLSIELMFYLVAPFIVHRSTLFVIFLIITSLLVRFFIYNQLGYTNDPWTYRFFLSELSLFLFGTMAYRLSKFFYIKNNFILFVIFTIIIINFLFYEYIYKNLNMLNNWYLYVLFAFSIPYIFRFSSNSKLDAAVGNFSYPVYVSHIFIISITSFIINKFNLHHYLAEITIIIVTIFSYFLILFISNPVEKIRKNNILKGRINDN